MISQRAVLVCVLVLAPFISVSCRKQAAGWKGSIERRDGLTIVKNPKAPLYGPEICEIKKDLTIGKAEGEKEYIFSEIGGMDADGDGNIYIIDRADAHVRVFDNKGRYLRTIGHKGEGPGETQFPVFIQITSKNEVFVYDYAGRAVFYSLAGRFLRQSPTGRPCLPVKLDSSGNLTGLEISAPPPVGGIILKKFDSGFRLIAVIAREEQGISKVLDIGKPALCCCAMPSDQLVWGNSGEYVLHVLNVKGDLVKTIEKEYDPVAITSKDKEAYKKKYEGPLQAGAFRLNFHDHFPAFSAISADDAGRIFVRTYEHVEGTVDSFYYDVFYVDGRYIAKLPLKVGLNRECVWKNHKLYAIESEEQGFQVVNRYAVSWKK
jgi:hypothetical protein